MKILLKKEVCGSCEQCTGPIGKAEMSFLKKKKKTNVDADANTHPRNAIQMEL